MGGQVRVRRAPASRTAGGAASVRPGQATRAPGPGSGSGLAERLLHLQRQAGNQAVVQLLARDPPLGGQAVVQRAGSHPENAPVTTLNPPGSLTEAQWTAAYQAAKANPSAQAFEPLIRDIAVTAGMPALGPGFVPARVPLSDGKTAQPGLNMSMTAGDKPGHAGWVDSSGAFGVRFQLDKVKPPDRQVGVVLSVGVLSADKGLSLHTVRHEMVHARHKQKVLAAVKAWQSLPVRGRPSFGDWLGNRPASASEQCRRWTPS